MVVHLKTVTGECYCGCHTQPEKLVDRWAGVVKCWCERCDKEQASPNEISLFLRFRMNLCPICGDKRCPRAADHRNECATELAK